MGASLNEGTLINSSEERTMAKPANQAVDFSIMVDGQGFTAPTDFIGDIPFGNMRRSRSEKELNELCEAVRLANVVTQGVTVRVDTEDHTRLQLIAGYGRLHAARANGFETIPAVFKVADDNASLSMMISENHDRTNTSIADDIVATTKMHSLCNGNFTQTAKELGKPVLIVKSLVLLSHCAPEVLQALHDEQILVGHAEILSQFTEIIQVSTLANIIKEDWAVEKLKERAGVATRKLSDAIFDIAACASCVHNTTEQSDLFSNTVGTAKCANLKCYRDKTTQELLVRKTQLETEHSMVIIATDATTAGTKEVTASMVGDKQLNEGCAKCTSNAVVIIDSIARNAGTVVNNQCSDNICLTKMIGKQSKSSKAVKAEPVKKTKVVDNKSTPSTKDAESSTSSQTAKSVEKTGESVVAKIPSAVKEHNANLLREVSALVNVDNDHLMFALGTAAIIKDSSVNDFRELPFDLNIDASYRYDQNVFTLVNLSPEQLTDVNRYALTYTMNKTSTDTISSIRKIMIDAIKLSGQGEVTAIKTWKADKGTLSNYMKGGISALCNESGFATAYDAKYGVAAFKKLENKSKTDLVKGIVADDFDWTNFAPTDYLDILKKPI